MNNGNADVRDLLRGKKFVNGEWVSVVEVEDAEPERDRELSIEDDALEGTHSRETAGEDVNPAPEVGIGVVDMRDAVDDLDVQIDFLGDLAPACLRRGLATGDLAAGELP